MRFLKKMPLIHPNGFWIYLAKVFRNGSRIRIHYWPSGVTRLDTPHDHRSWFISIPIFGWFLEKRFKEIDGNEFDVVKCHSTTSGNNGTSLTTPAGKGNVIAVSSHWRVPLIPYFCSVNTIHSLIPKNLGPALTLVFFGTPKKTPKAWIKNETIGTEIRHNQVPR